MTLPCPYCEEFKTNQSPYTTRLFSERTLTETPHFVVFLSLGPLTEGHCLIVPKECYLNIQSLPLAYFTELEQLHRQVKNHLRKTYGSAISFEHGPHQKNKAGCCVDHCHLHVAPLQTDLFPELSQQFERKNIPTLQELKKVQSMGRPYLLFENNENQTNVFWVKTALPSQFLRYLLAEKNNCPERANWRQYIGEKEIQQAAEKLRPLFNARNRIQ